MRALFLTKYGTLGASTRYRALQYLPCLADRGWEVEWQPLLSDRYLQQLYLRGRRPFAEVCAGYARRLRYLWTSGLARFDVVFVQYETLPYVPFWLERPLTATTRNLVLDYDDAVFVGYENNRLLSGKLPNLIRSAREVIVGNQSLLRFASRHNPKVSVIPTVIDTARYQPREDYACRDERGIVIGWVGTPVTVRYLTTMSGALQILARKHRILVRCVGGPGDFAIPGVRVENVPWRQDTEVDTIRSFDIGVMPLADEPFAHGKCGLKLIQYMGCGVPSAGANLGANAEIIRNGVDGFLASGDGEYVEIIERLIGGQRLRERIGRAGRSTVEERYSLRVRAQEFCGVLERAARGGEFQARRQRVAAQAAG